MIKISEYILEGRRQRNFHRYEIFSKFEILSKKLNQAIAVDQNYSAVFFDLQNKSKILISDARLVTVMVHPNYEGVIDLFKIESDE